MFAQRVYFETSSASPHKAIKTAIVYSLLSSAWVPVKKAHCTGWRRLSMSICPQLVVISEQIPNASLQTQLHGLDQSNQSKQNLNPECRPTVNKIVCHLTANGTNIAETLVPCEVIHTIDIIRTKVDDRQKCC